MGLFHHQPSLSELEEQEESLHAEQRVTKTKREIMEEKVAIKELEERLGKGSVFKLFSSNGKRSGFSLSKAKEWIKNH